MKYKLIKEYPGSLQLGTEVTDDKAWKHVIKTYPEFWEKVKEENYKILSFGCPNDDRIFNINSDGKYLSKNGYPCKLDQELEWIASKKRFIHSVRRMSDGAIFTIGDRVEYTYNDVNHILVTKTCNIEKIYFIESDRIAIYVGMGLNLGIKSINHTKTPLFTTEDGIGIFEGDKFYSLYPDFTILDGNITQYVAEFPFIISNTGKLINFSTKQAAEAYIQENKPKYSEKDMLSFGKIVYNKSSYIIGDLTVEFNKWHFSKFNKARDVNINDIK